MASRTIPARPPREGRPKGRFTQHRRIDALQEVLEAHPNGVTLEALAKELRITTRSVRRYLAELARHTELESVAIKAGGAHAWRIKPSERGRAVTLRRTQAYGLLATRPIFEAMRGSALYDEMDVVLRQLLLIGQRPTRAGVKGEAPSDTRLHERFLFVPPAARSYGAKGEELDAVFGAVASSRVLTFRYRHRSSDERGERVIFEPYALVHHGGCMYCVGRDREQDGIRVFRVEGMSEARAREDQAFVLPDGFDVRAHLDGDFGVGADVPATRVLVEFDAAIADDVRTR